MFSFSTCRALSSFICFCFSLFFFFFKQKTAYEMRISDWSSDVCSSDLSRQRARGESTRLGAGLLGERGELRDDPEIGLDPRPHAGEIGRASCRERVCQYV